MPSDMPAQPDAPALGGRQHPQRADADDLVVGIDIGGTKLEAAAFRGGQQTGESVRVGTRNLDPAGIADATVSVVKVLEASSGGDSAVSAIGIGIAGQVDPRAGTVRHALNLGIGAEPVDFAAMMRERSDAPVLLENDVNTAAFGAFEDALLTQPDLKSLAFLALGTGVGAGVVLSGAVHRGSRGVAGEVGHFPIDSRAERVCDCGLSGCLEMSVSGRAIEAVMSKHAAGSPAHALFLAAGDGDPAAERFCSRLADHIAVAVYLLAVTFDTERTVVGGGVAAAGQPLMSAIHTAIDRLERRSEFVASLDLARGLIIRPTDGLGAAGAAALARRAIATERIA